MRVNTTHLRLFSDRYSKICKSEKVMDFQDENQKSKNKSSVHWSLRCHWYSARLYQQYFLFIPHLSWQCVFYVHEPRGNLLSSWYHKLLLLLLTVAVWSSVAQLCGKVLGGKRRAALTKWYDKVVISFKTLMLMDVGPGFFKRILMFFTIIIITYLPTGAISNSVIQLRSLNSTIQTFNLGPERRWYLKKTTTVSSIL